MNKNIDITPECDTLFIIETDDLTVGEFNAMEGAAVVWAGLRGVNQDHLQKLITRLEKDENTKTKLSLPVFKMILFFAQHLTEYVDENKELSAALDKAQEEAERNEFMEAHGVPIISE